MVKHGPLRMSLVLLGSAGRVRRGLVPLGLVWYGRFGPVRLAGLGGVWQER